MLMYVLLTGRQPFSTPKTDDPMVVMRRIVDENYQIKYPPYLSPHAKVCHTSLASRQAGADCWCLCAAADKARRAPCSYPSPFDFTSTRPRWSPFSTGSFTLRYP